MKSLNILKLRLGIYSFYLSVIAVPIFLDVTKNIEKIDAGYLLFWFLLSFVSFLIFEYLLLYLSKKKLKEETSNNIRFSSLGQANMLTLSPSHAENLDSTRNADLLCDSFKSFVDNDNNLKALKKFLGCGGNLRVLIMNPFGTGPELTAMARKNVRNMSTAEDFSSEIIHSIRRLSNFLTIEQLLKSVRFYNYPSFYASYIFDEEAFVTIFTYGRGGSSPTLYVSNKPKTMDDFFDGITRGFSELWEASTEGTLNQDLLKKLL